MIYLLLMMVSFPSDCISHNHALPAGDNKSRSMISNFLAMTALIVAAGMLPVQYANAQDNTEETFTLNLQNVDIHTLIENVSIRTGRNFIVDPRVKATVNVVLSKPVTAEKLYEMFLSVLEVHGYAAVQAGQLIKIIPSSVATQHSVPLLLEGEASGDELVSHIIHLKGIPALELIETLRPLLSDSAGISAESTSNTLLITDHAANIEKVIELITLIEGG